MLLNKFEAASAVAILDNIACLHETQFPIQSIKFRNGVEITVGLAGEIFITDSEEFETLEGSTTEEQYKSIEEFRNKYKL